MVRVAFAGISHETNTFATEALGLTTLEQFNPRTGPAALKGGDGYMGGLVHKATELGSVSNERLAIIHSFLDSTNHKD